MGYVATQNVAVMSCLFPVSRIGPPDLFQFRIHFWNYESI